MTGNNLDPRKLSWLSRTLLRMEVDGHAKRAFYLLCGVCALLFVADLFYKKKAYLAADSFFSFYPVFGFAACLLIGLASPLIRSLISRAEGYYAPNDVETEEWPEAELERKDADV